MCWASDLCPMFCLLIWSPTSKSQVHILVPGSKNGSPGPKTNKMRTEEPCRTPPPEFQMEPYGASYGQNTFWGKPSQVRPTQASSWEGQCSQTLVFYSFREPFGILPARPVRPAKWCQQVLLRASLPRAPGARMTVVNQLPQTSCPWLTVGNKTSRREVYL